MLLALAAARCSRGVNLARLSRGKADDAAIEIKKLELAAVHLFEQKKLEILSNANKGLFEKMCLKSETAQVFPDYRVYGVTVPPDSANHARCISRPLLVLLTLGRSCPFFLSDSQHRRACDGVVFCCNFFTLPR